MTHGGSGGSDKYAEDRAGVVADLRAVAETDREVVRWLRQDQLYVHRLAHDWKMLRQRVNAFLDQFAGGSHALLRYVGLAGEGKLAQALQRP